MVMVRRGSQDFVLWHKDFAEESEWTLLFRLLQVLCLICLHLLQIMLLMPCWPLMWCSVSVAFAYAISSLVFSNCMPKPLSLLPSWLSFEVLFLLCQLLLSALILFRRLGAFLKFSPEYVFTEMQEEMLASFPINTNWHSLNLMSPVAASSVLYPSSV